MAPPKQSNRRGSRGQTGEKGDTGNTGARGEQGAAGGMDTAQKVDLAVLQTEMQQVHGALLALRGDFERYVTHPEFLPVKMIAYGLAGGVLLTVLGGVLAKVVIQ